jgi:SWI/SNF-related matrix-associated actin-dependent regulator 1 of chromatin subfamily A
LDTDRPYQVEGAKFLAERRNALLAFDTRLGKTRTSLRAAELVQARRVLVLAPAIGRVSWKIEAPLVTALPVRIAGPGDRPPVDLSLADPVLLVLAYDALSNDKHGWLKFLCSMRWDVLILDECQYLKSAGSNRTKAVYGRLISYASRVWCLSATPTPNHAGEMWPHIKALWPDLVAHFNRTTFEDHFCSVQHTPWGRRIKGSRNQAELRDLLAPHVLRKRKTDVFKDLPRMAHHMVPLDMPPGHLEPEEWAEAGSLLDQLLAQPINAESASIMREVGEAKALPAAAWLDEQLSQRIVGKIVVFAWHRTVLKTLFKRLADYDPAYLDGSTDQPARELAVSRFQSDPNCRVFVGQLKAAGSAIALDAADDCAIVEPSWVPMDNYQAASRIEHVGRRKPSTVSWLYAPDTLDERLMSALRRKTREISQLWD